jgi:hypothetical protein
MPSYVIACRKGKKGVIIDPSHEWTLSSVSSHPTAHRNPYHRHHTLVDHVSLAPELADRLMAKTVMNRNTPRHRESWGQRSRTSSGSRRSLPRTREKDRLYLGDGDGLRIGDHHTAGDGNEGPYRDTWRSSPATDLHR